MSVVVAAEVLAVNPMWSIIFWVKILVPMVTVFIAMYGAQHIFNSNARKREDRERRLKALESMLSYANETTDLTHDYLHTKTEHSDTKYRSLRTRSLHMLTLTDIYFPQIKNSVENFLDKIHHINTLQIDNAIEFHTNITCDIHFVDTAQQSQYYSDKMPIIWELVDAAECNEAINLIGVVVKRIICEHMEVEEK